MSARLVVVVCSFVRVRCVLCCYERTEGCDRKKKIRNFWPFSLKTFNLQPQTSNLKTYNLQPTTSNRKPQTPNLQPQTPNLKPQTYNLKPQTANLKPQTANRKPQTANRKPQKAQCQHHKTPLPAFQKSPVPAHVAGSRPTPANL